MARIVLKPRHVQPVWAGHPWVFAQAIARVDGAPGPGDVVDVFDPEGKRLGRGYYSPKSAIPVRIATRGDDDIASEPFFRGRLREAIARRAAFELPSGECSGYRLVHGASDGIPGLVVDMYADTAVIQLGTAAMARYEDIVVAALREVPGLRNVLRASVDAEAREGVKLEPAVLRGDAGEGLRFTDRGFDVRIPRALQQKTGYYFDQRDNRAIVEALAGGKRVLDLYSYVGGFAWAAARGGAAHVLSIDSSLDAVLAGAQIAHDNGFDGIIRSEKSDVRKKLAALAREDARFDLVVADPPKLIPTRKHVERGQRAYRRLMADALRRVESGGHLLGCSCSAAMTLDRFLRTLALSARDAGREVRVVRVGAQAPDHPYPPAFPQGQYLDAVLLEVSA